MIKKRSYQLRETAMTSPAEALDKNLKPRAEQALEVDQFFQNMISKHAREKQNPATPLTYFVHSIRD